MELTQFFFHFFFKKRWRRLVMGRTGTGWQSDVARQVVGRRRWDDTGRLSMAADPRLLAAHNIQPLSFFFLLFFSIFFALFIALFVVCVLSDVYRFVSLEKSIVGRPRVPLRGLLFFKCVCVSLFLLFQVACSRIARNGGRGRYGPRLIWLAGSTPSNSNRKTKWTKNK